MTKLNEIVEKVRSKNAGPFTLTIDIFCGSKKNLKRIMKNLPCGRLSKLFLIEEPHFKIFEIESLNVIKITFPRSVIQGCTEDRDLHGASWGSFLGEIEID